MQGGQVFCWTSLGYPFQCTALPPCAASNGVLEVDNTQQPALVLSVLHLPPGSSVHASYLSAGLSQQANEAGGT